MTWLPIPVRLPASGKVVLLRSWHRSDDTEYLSAEDREEQEEARKAWYRAYHPIGRKQRVPWLHRLIDWCWRIYFGLRCNHCGSWKLPTRRCARCWS